MNSRDEMKNSSAGWHVTAKERRMAVRKRSKKSSEKKKIERVSVRVEVNQHWCGAVVVFTTPTYGFRKADTHSLLRCKVKMTLVERRREHSASRRNKGADPGQEKKNTCC